MSCRYNSWGQPACCITFHPDYPHEKFCVNCRQRFYQNLPISYPTYPQRGPSGVFFLIITVLMLVILFRVIPNRSPNVTPLRQNPRFETLGLVIQQSLKQG